MGIMDVFNADDRVELRVNDLIYYFRQEAKMGVERNLIINGLKNHIPAEYILKMIGEDIPEMDAVVSCEE